MKRGLFLCGSGLLGAGAIVALPTMLAPLVAGPVASDAPALWAEPARGSPATAASTAVVKRKAYFLTGNAGRSTRNHEPAAVSTEPIMTNSHTMAVARAPEMVSDPSTQASGSPISEPIAAAEKLVAAPRQEDVHVALPEIPEPVFAGPDSRSAAVAAPPLDLLVIELPEVPTLLVASELDMAPKSPEEDEQPSPSPQPTTTTGYSGQAFAGGAASLIHQPESKPGEVAAEPEQVSRGSEVVSSPSSPGSQDRVTIVSPSSEELVPPRSVPQEQWPKPRIFIHHSSRDRDLALRVATKLNNVGFGIAEFRTKNDGPSVASIRYFFDEDRAAAIASRKSVRSSLSPAVPVRLQDFRHYEPKPSRGTVEVWAPSREPKSKVVNIR